MTDERTGAGVFSPAGRLKFEAWLAKVAKPHINARTLLLDAERVIGGRLSTGESPRFELWAKDSLLGRPEVFLATADDLSDQATRCRRQLSQAAANCGGMLSVVPLRIDSEDWVQTDAAVGRAASYDEALGMLIRAGYQVLEEGAGGIHELDDEPGSDRYLISVSRRASARAAF